MSSLCMVQYLLHRGRQKMLSIKIYTFYQLDYNIVIKHTSHTVGSTVARLFCKIFYNKIFKWVMV
jgi:hypothetical protein